LNWSTTNFKSWATNRSSSTIIIQNTSITSTSQNIALVPIVDGHNKAIRNGSSTVLKEVGASALELTGAITNGVTADILKDSATMVLVVGSLDASVRVGVHVESLVFVEWELSVHVILSTSVDTAATLARSLNYIELGWNDRSRHALVVHERSLAEAATATGGAVDVLGALNASVLIRGIRERLCNGGADRLVTRASGAVIGASFNQGREVLAAIAAICIFIANRLLKAGFRVLIALAVNEALNAVSRGSIAVRQVARGEPSSAVLVTGATTAGLDVNGRRAGLANLIDSNNVAGKLRVLRQSSQHTLLDTTGNASDREFLS